MHPNRFHSSVDEFPYFFGVYLKNKIEGTFKPKIQNWVKMQIHHWNAME